VKAGDQRGVLKARMRRDVRPSDRVRAGRAAPSGQRHAGLAAIVEDPASSLPADAIATLKGLAVMSFDSFNAFLPSRDRDAGQFWCDRLEHTHEIG